MKLYTELLNSSQKHIKGHEYKLKFDDINIDVAKEERFAFQILLKSNENFFCQLTKTNDIDYRGLNNKIRVDIECDNLEENFDMSFEGYVNDDNNDMVADIILEKKSMYINDFQCLWIEGKIPKSYKNNIMKLKIKFYHSKGYENEVLINEKEVVINVRDIVMKSIGESEFFLDLWQHPCNLARVYDVEYFSDEHFNIIENYISEMSKIGQRVINLVVTDYPWAGQGCYEIHDNIANLFELNIVKVYKENKKIVCDFSNLDKYIDICLKHNIDKEINLFGIIGNWDFFKFGSPVENYKDSIRINYYDKDTKIFKYISEKSEFSEYLNLLFTHLKKRRLLDITKIICDEPDNINIFNENVKFIQQSTKYKLKYKCAIHHQEFFENCDIEIENLSLNTCELIHNINSIDNIKSKLKSKNGYLTWYSCWFPKKLNIFLDSHLIESRLKGWFTYYFNLDGFLRWAYGVWPEDIFNNTSYKSDRWKSGDMYLVYPGKNLKPMDSLRLRNLVFGIQDFILLKQLEESMSKEYIIHNMKNLLGDKENMEFIGSEDVKTRDVLLNYDLEYKNYMTFKSKLYSQLEGDKMIKIRSAKIGEFSKCMNLINNVFRISRGHNPTMQDEFPLLINKNNIENMIVAVDDDKVVSEVNYLKQVVDIEGYDINVASIGAVCTDESYRGKKLSSKVLDFVENKMYEDDIDVVLISGTRSLYTRRNCSVVKCFDKYTVSNKSKYTDYDIVEYDTSYINDMYDLYVQNKTKFIRSIEEFEVLLNSSTIPWGDITYKNLVIKNNDKVCGYIVLQIKNNKIGIVKEMNTNNLNIYNILSHLVYKYELSYIEYLTHIKDKKNRLNINFDKCEKDYLHGSIKIINYQSLFKKLKKYFNNYVEKEIVDNITLTKEDDKYILSYLDEELILKDLDELNKLIFEGYESVKDRLDKKPNLYIFITKVFPIHFVDTYNLNYQ